MQKQIYELLLVSVPEAEKYVLVPANFGHDKVQWLHKGMCYIQEIPKDNYKLIGTYPGITEEQAALLVNSMLGLPQDYLREGINCTNVITFLQSFESLMQANGVYLVSPEGLKPDLKYYASREDFETDLSDWQSAQETTSAKWVVLQVIK